MKIFVLFVEPMLYGLDIINEVYDQTEHEFRYVYCYHTVTGKDGLALPSNAIVCEGNRKEKRVMAIAELQKFNANLVIINGYIGNVQHAIIRYCQRHKINYCIESDTPLNIPRSRLKALAKKIYLKNVLSNRHCYGFPGGTKQMENLVFYGIPKERCYIMPMSVSSKRILRAWEDCLDRDTLRKRLGIEDKMVFLFVGRLEEAKDVEILVEAFKRIENRNVTLLIVGDGSKGEALKEQASMCHNIIFAGYQAFPKLIEYYKISDFLVLPSKFEPWGLVVNEAFTLSTPVIVSSAVGCNADIVRDGINGFIFQSGDVEDLLRSIGTAIECDLTEMKRQACNTALQWNLTLYRHAFRSAIECIMK